MISTNENSAGEGGAIRVLTVGIAAGDREILRHSLRNFRGFRLVAETDSAAEYATMAADVLPELVICRDRIPLEVLRASDRPVLITIGLPGRVPWATCDVAIPVRIDEVNRALEIASERILAKKLSDLHQLIRWYTSGTASFPSIGQDFTVVDDCGNSITLAANSIQWVESEGNYVRFHTRTETFTARATMSSIAIQLESHSFVRIHRGTVVNANAIREVILVDGVARHVLLEDGTRLRVGPNFRNQLNPYGTSVAIGETAAEGGLHA